MTGITPSKRARKASNKQYYIIFAAVVGLLIIADSTIRRKQAEKKGEVVAIIDPLARSVSERGFTASCVDLLESVGFKVEVLQ